MEGQGSPRPYSARGDQLACNPYLGGETLVSTTVHIVLYAVVPRLIMPITMMVPIVVAFPVSLCVVLVMTSLMHRYYAA